MGGSITSTKILLELGKYKKTCSTKIFCVDSTDVTQIKKIRDVIDLHSSKFLVISKSGNTLETISIFSAFFHMYTIAKIPTPDKHFCFITSLKESQLTKIAYDNNIQILPHDNTISGRFSSFRNITLLPASIANLDVSKFCQGGRSILQDCLTRRISSPPVKATQMLYHFNNMISVNITFDSMLSPFLEWYAQIQAESLAKDNHSITPIVLESKMVHHGHLQLYLEGKKDKIFTLINCVNTQDLEIYHNTVCRKPRHSMKHVNNILYNSVYSTFMKHRLPFRSITLHQINEYDIGAIMMHAILETTLTAKLFNICPFDQPAVEKIKKLCKSA